MVHQSVKRGSLQTDEPPDTPRLLRMTALRGSSRGAMYTNADPHHQQRHPEIQQLYARQLEERRLARQRDIENLKRITAFHAHRPPPNNGTGRSQSRRSEATNGKPPSRPDQQHRTSRPGSRPGHCSMLADLRDLESLAGLQAKMTTAGNGDGGASERGRSVTGDREEGPEERQPQAPVRRRRRSKRRKSELEEQGDGDSRVVGHPEVSDPAKSVPDALAELLRESERQLGELRADELARSRANGRTDTVTNDHVLFDLEEKPTSTSSTGECTYLGILTRYPVLLSLPAAQPFSLIL
ncbi:uncharacterized protein LOC106645859 [Copidosoma floridanum]|uniref:uncharacterized protein LOC106645859 n=1 Tax=Copidosoma floridanum TaxID=29053 RepID=UPI000C6FA1A8|nr:uncharacterized protein LOC106645859 [Copidosoma floridanum]